MPIQRTTSRRADRVARAATVAALTAHLGAIGLVAVLGLLAQDPVLDPWRPVAIAALYAAPAVLAAAGLRGRRPLLLVAAVTVLVLAVLPFSLHSFVLGPAGIVYAAAYAALSTPQSVTTTVAAVLGCSLLLVGAFVILVVHEDPVCYRQMETGEIIVDRDPGPVASGTQTLEAGSGVVQAGCTSDSVAWWQAAGSVALSGAAILTGLRLVPPVTRRLGAGRPAS